MTKRTLPSFLFSNLLFHNPLLLTLPLLLSSFGQAAQLRGVDPTLSNIRLLDGADQLVATANPTPDTPKSLAYVGDALQVAFDFQDSDCEYEPSSEDYDSCVLAEQPDLREVYWFGGQQSESGLHTLTAQDQTPGDRSVGIIAHGENQLGNTEQGYQWADFSQLIILDNFQDDNAHADETQLNSIWVMAAGDAPTLKFLRPVLLTDMGSMPENRVSKTLDWVDAAGVRQANYQSHRWLLTTYEEAQNYCQSIGAQVPTLAQMHRLTQAGAPDVLNQQSELFAHFALYRHAWPKDSDIRYWTQDSINTHLRIAAAIATHIEQVQAGDLLIENSRSPGQRAALICVQPSDQLPNGELSGQFPESLDFGQQSQLSFTLTNRGQLPLQHPQIDLNLPDGLSLIDPQDQCRGQQSLVSGASCQYHATLQADFVGIYQLNASANFTGADPVPSIAQQLIVNSLAPPKTVKCPNVPVGNLFEIGQAVPYRVMQDGEDASAGVRNEALRDKLEQGEERWCVSQVTDMREVFYNAHSFNQPIGDWDVGNVTSMYMMFHSATNFNQPIGDWDVGQVSTMQAMFAYTSKFNQPIGDWQVGKVTNMRGMFYDATQFNQDLTGWDVHQVTNHTNFNAGSSGLPDAKCPKFNDGKCQ